MNTYKARSPIVCLPYHQRHKAVGKELIIDYSTGNVYTLSEDRSRLIDITKTIADRIDTISSGHITVDIDGNPVNLTEIINQVMNTVEKSIIATDPGDSVFFSGDKKVDNLSIETIFNKIQLKGFNTATDKTFPMKDNGVISWVSIASAGGLPGDPDNTDGVNTTRVIGVEPVNGRIYLNAVKRQTTSNLRENSVVVLPRVYDEFSEIWWLVKTYSFKPTLSFTSNVTFISGESMQPTSDCYHIYKFTTWDSGDTWLGELLIFGQDSSGGPDTGIITKDWVEQNYYTKKSVDELYISKNYASSAYYTKSETLNMFATKEDLSTVVLDEDRVMELVNGRLQWLNQS